MFFFWSEVSLRSTTQKIEISRKICRSALDILKRTLCISSNAFRRPKNAVFFCLCTLPYLLGKSFSCRDIQNQQIFVFWKSRGVKWNIYYIYITSWAFVSRFLLFFCLLLFRMFVFVHQVLPFPCWKQRMMDLDFGVFKNRFLLYI